MKRSGCENNYPCELALQLGICRLPILFAWAGNLKEEITKDSVVYLCDLCYVFPKISAVPQSMGTMPGSS